VRRQPRGFTLLEVAVALAILGIGVVTVLQIFQGALRLQMRAAEQSRMVLAARQKMDGLLSEPIDPEQRCGGHLPEGFDCEVRLAKPVDLGMTDEEWEEMGIPIPDDEGLGDAEDGEPALYVVELKAPWHGAADGRSFTVRTFRYYDPSLWSELEMAE
jgi:prepilin-type N-terminal cleavage/methylation domain-containing protein